MAQPRVVRSVPVAALPVGLLLSAPVLGFGLVPMGDFSEPEVAGFDAAGLSLEA